MRVYGEIRGLSPEAWARLARACPFDEAAYGGGTLEIQHEGSFVDATGFMEALAAALGPEAEGHLDVIDNDDWTITRHVVQGGKWRFQTFGIDDVLENTKNEGNI